MSCRYHNANAAAMWATALRLNNSNQDIKNWDSFPAFQPKSRTTLIHIFAHRQEPQERWADMQGFCCDTEFYSGISNTLLILSYRKSAGKDKGSDSLEPECKVFRILQSLFSVYFNFLVVLNTDWKIKYCWKDKKNN